MENYFQERRTESIAAPPVQVISNEGCDERRWYAVFTMPQHERNVSRRLSCRGIESFLPTYEKERVWRNRQRVKIQLPVFPSYLFVNAQRAERYAVMSDAGVVRIVGNSRGPMPISDVEIDYVRTAFNQSKIEPYTDVEIGQTVRIKHGPLHGITGQLVRKNGSLKFVLRLDLIHLSAAVEINAADVELISAAVA